MSRRSVLVLGSLRALGGRALPLPLLAAALALSATPAQAQRERYAPLILQLPVSARSAAMGGLSMGSRDADAAFGNPALAGGSNAVSLSGARYASGASAGHVATAMTVGPLGVAVGMQLLDARSRLGDFPARSDVLTDEGARATAGLGANVAASFAWKGVRWGASARYVEERFSDVRATSAALDLGAAKSFLSGAVMAGVAVQNLGRDLEIGAATAQLPARLSLGAAGGYGNFTWFDVAASANVAVRRDGRVVPAAGAEVTYVPIEGVAIAVRGGARSPELRAQRPLTAGLGVSFDRLVLDYGWEDMRLRGGAHHVTLRLR